VWTMVIRERCWFRWEELGVEGTVGPLEEALFAVAPLANEPFDGFLE